jgi:hypothetical protein
LTRDPAAFAAQEEEEEEEEEEAGSRIKSGMTK